MKDHHEYLCDKLFKSIILNPDHKLNSLLPARYNTNYNRETKGTSTPHKS